MGITNKVSTVENANPQTIAVATGPQISDLPARPAASENNPAMVVREVISIGITRRRAAYTVACKRLMPFSRRELAAEIKTIAAFTEIPARATMPYIVYRLIGLLVTNKPRTTPVDANNTVAILIKGRK